MLYYCSIGAPVVTGLKGICSFIRAIAWIATALTIANAQVHRYTQIVKITTPGWVYFTLDKPPVIEVIGQYPETLDVYRNGLLQTHRYDYQFFPPAQIKFLPASLPQVGDVIVLRYDVAPAVVGTLVNGVCMPQGTGFAQKDDGMVSNEIQANCRLLP